MMNTQIKDGNVAVAVFKSHIEAEQAVKDLQKAQVDMKHLSIIGRDYHTEENVVGYYNTGERMKAWGTAGAVWGGFWGLLLGAAFFWVPTVGPVLVAGPLVATIVSGLEGAVMIGGLSALGASLYGLGIPKDSVLMYETDIKAGKFALILHGTAGEIAQAKAILHQANAEHLTDYAAQLN